MNHNADMPKIPENLYHSLSAVGLNNTEAKILLYLTYVLPYATQEEISETLGLSRSLVSMALSKMTSMGIIVIRRSGRVKEYYVKSIRHVVRRLLGEVRHTVLPLEKEILDAAKKLPRNQDPERQKKIQEVEQERAELVKIFTNLFKMLGGQNGTSGS